LKNRDAGPIKSVPFVPESAEPGRGGQDLPSIRFTAAGNG
jgi:hypothetical protein